MITTEQHRLSHRLASKKYWRDRADRFIALGLNTRGDSRTYRVWPELIGLTGLARRARRQQLTRQFYQSLGLTTRKTIPAAKLQPRFKAGLHGFTSREKRRTVANLRYQANYALGLTARGTIRRHKAWRRIKMEAA